MGPCRIREAMSEGLTFRSPSGKIQLREYYKIATRIGRPCHLLAKIDPMPDFMKQGAIKLRCPDRLLRNGKDMATPVTDDPMTIGQEPLEFFLVIRPQ